MCGNPWLIYSLQEMEISDKVILGFSLNVQSDYLSRFQ